MAESASNSEDYSHRLTRFLHFGNENGLYRAGCGEFQPSFTTDPDKPSIVHEMLDAERGEEIVEEISKVLSSNSPGASRVPALYALAVCARHADESHKTKQAAMKVFATSCDTTADLFTFITYANSVKESKKGWGRALKTGVQRWFDSRDAMTLAKIITKQRTGSHWSYLDLLRVTHILPKTEGAKMIAKYLVKGLKAAKEEYGGEKTSNDMKAALSYLEAVEKLKSVTDEVVAISVVEQYQLCFQQVMSRLQMMPQVLVALVKQMSLQEVFDNIGRLATRHILEPEFPAASDIVQRICDQEALQEERISPITVTIALRTYEIGFSGRKWTRNNSVVEALDTALAMTLRHNALATGKRCLLAVNINQSFSNCWVRGARVLSPVFAASAFAVMLAHTENQASLAYFDSEVRPMPLSTSMNILDVCRAINQEMLKVGQAKSIGDMSAPLTWAETQEKPYDVIIVMTDFRHPRAFTDFTAVFRQYKQTAGLPNAKLVMCGLTANFLQFASSEEPGMLDIAGFDASVPSVIHSFVTDSL